MLVLLNLAVHSEAQRRAEVTGVCEVPIVRGVGTTPVSIMRQSEIEDEVSRSGRVLDVVDDLDVAALLPFAGRDAELRARLMASRAEERAKHRDHPAVCFLGT